MDELKRVEMEEEQQLQFERIEKAVGSTSAALFCCCAVFDVPFRTEAVPVDHSVSKRWTEYLKKLRFRGWDKKGKARFRDGTTDFLKVFGEDVPAEETAELIKEEAKHQKKVNNAGTELQMNTWGKGNPENPLTKEDYDRLDYFYETLTSRLNSAGGVDNQQELILRKVAELYREEEKLRAEGNIGDAQKCVKMALDLLSSEQLQRKDAKPVEDVRIDSIMDALENWGAVQDGKILSFEQLTEFLLKELGRLGGTPAHRYTQTLDAADYELKFIQNCMAQNEDLPQWMELPDNMRFPEEVANEFSPEPSDDEIRAYEGIGIVRNRDAAKDTKEES